MLGRGLIFANATANGEPVAAISAGAATRRHITSEHQEQVIHSISTERRSQSSSVHETMEQMGFAQRQQVG
jgi:hypothetical protein